MQRNLSSLDAACELQDVPVVFLIGTEDDESVEKVARLIRQRSFSAFFLNSSTSFSCRQLEILAAAECVNESLQPAVRQVFDLWCNFTCLEENLFSLTRENCDCLLFAEPETANFQKETEAIADGLFCVFISQATVPVIRYDDSVVCRQIVALLTEKLKDYAAPMRKSYAGRDRPLLILYDRSRDLLTPLQHSWKYCAMIGDLFDFTANRIQLSQGGERIDLETGNDFFWKRYAHLPSYEVAAAIDTELAAYLQEKAQVSGGDDASLPDAASNSLLENAASGQLKEMLAKIPLLAHKKRLIDCHTNIATAIMKQIEARKLDVFIAQQQACIQKSPAAAAAALKTITSPDGLQTDRLRLAIIYLLCFGEQQNLITLLLQSLPEHAPLFKKIISCLQRSFEAASTPLQTAASSVAATSTATSPKAAAAMFGSLISAGIKKLSMQDARDADATPIKNCVETLLSHRDSPIGNFRNYTDPAAGSNDKKWTPDCDVFNSVTVFTVGSSSWTEYSDVIALEKQYPRLRITFGASAFSSGATFLANLIKNANAK